MRVQGNIYVYIYTDRQKFQVNIDYYIDNKVQPDNIFLELAGIYIIY